MALAILDTLDLIDTNCAIVGSITAVTTESFPGDWLDRRERLPYTPPERE